MHIQQVLSNVLKKYTTEEAIQKLVDSEYWDEGSSYIDTDWGIVDIIYRVFTGHSATVDRCDGVYK